MAVLSARLGSEQIYRALREDILSAALQPGEAISEARMAARFGVSRTPVRETFKRLGEEGFLQVVPQVGTFVALINLAAVYDSQFVRETLECRTVVLAAERVEAADRQRLEAMISDQAQAVAAGNRQTFFRLDDALHAYLARMSGHPSVWNLIEDVKAQLDRVRCLSLQSERWPEMILDQHRGIVAHVCAGDAQRAEAAMRQHLRTVFDAIENIAKNYIDAFQQVPRLADQVR